jgi:hypothetical protein
LDYRSLTWIANLSPEVSYFADFLQYGSTSGDFSTFLLTVNNLLDKLQDNHYMQFRKLATVLVVNFC